MADFGSVESKGVVSSESRRRALVAIAVSTFLPGCASLKNSVFWGTILNATSPVGGKIDKAKVDAIPYASMIAGFRGNAAALVVLGEYLPESRLVWYSAERQSLTTWGPYVVRLLGTDVALRGMTFHGAWSTNVSEMIGRRSERRFDWQAEAGRLFSANAVSEFHDDGIEVIDILGERRRLRRIREKLVFSGHHRFSNDYWIDAATGFCWKSRQLLIPTMPTLELQVTRPPSVAQSAA